MTYQTELLDTGKKKASPEYVKGWARGEQAKLARMIPAIEAKHKREREERMKIRYNAFALNKEQAMKWRLGK